MPSLFDGIIGNENVREVYDKIVANYPGAPHSKSDALWRLRRATEIRGDNSSPEKMLEKAVAMLAERELPLHYRSLMDARHVSLEVVAPRRFFEGVESVDRMSDINAWLDQFETAETSVTPIIGCESLELGKYISEESQSLDEFARMKTDGFLSMSLNALAFPEDFDRIPFSNGQEVRRKCDTLRLSEEGQMVRDAFAGLTPVWSIS